MENIRNAYKIYKSIIKTNPKSVKILTYVTYILAFLISSAALILIRAKGEDDYIVSLFLTFMAYVAVNIVNAVRFNITSSRFFYSIPCAKEIATRIKPLITLTSSVIITLFSVVVLLILDAIEFTDFACIIDLLIFCSVGTFISLIISGLSSLAATIINQYIFGIPCVCIGFLHDVPFIAEFIQKGFEAPVFLSIIISVLSIIIGTILSMMISGHSFKNRSTKYMNALAAYSQMKN